MNSITHACVLGTVVNSLGKALTALRSGDSFPSEVLNDLERIKSWAIARRDAIGKPTTAAPLPVKPVPAVLATVPVAVPAPVVLATVPVARVPVSSASSAPAYNPTRLHVPAAAVPVATTPAAVAAKPAVPAKPVNAGLAAYHAAKKACKAAGLSTTGDLATLQSRLSFRQASAASAVPVATVAHASTPTVATTRPPVAIMVDADKVRYLLTLSKLSVADLAKLVECFQTGV